MDYLVSLCHRPPKVFRPVHHASDKTTGVVEVKGEKVAVVMEEEVGESL